jgi:inositol transport system ATP-binding protein
MIGISKNFPGVRALNNVDFRVKKGTVHALMGENGAGKSTLMKILLGIYSLEAGRIFFGGRHLYSKSIEDSLKSGISMIHQELTAIPNMTVAENIFLGREPRNGPFVDEKKLESNAIEILQEIGLRVDPRSTMKKLSTARKQMVEIAKAISFNPSLMIMDEPTSALTEEEVDHLFEIIRRLVNKGMTVIYISHKIDEIFRICDEVTVMRDGEVVGTDSLSNVNKNWLISKMVGRELTQFFPKIEVEQGEKLLEVKGLSLNGRFRDVSFYLKRGEILGFAGLMGSGRSEVMESIFGIRRLDSGGIFVRGKRVDIKSAADAISAGIGFLTEDRKGKGLFLPLSVSDNIAMPSFGDFRIRGLISERRIRAACNGQRKKLDIKTPSLSQLIRNLSGGNQQKALVARWLIVNPEILIVDEPTRGIDVGAKAEIHRILSLIAKEGKGIIMVSSELPEILGMSDRIIVMHEGRITGELSRAEATQEKILTHAVAVGR